MNKEDNNKKFAPWIGIVLFLLFATGGFGIFILLPILIIAAVIFTAKKKAAEGQTRQTASLFEEKKRAERRNSIPNMKNLYSESEQRHLSAMKSADHSEYEHFVNELDDLLAAGIIEKDEYRERVAALRAQYRI